MDASRQPDRSSHEALLEAAKLLHSSLELDELLSSLLRSVMGRLVVSRGLIALVDDHGSAEVSVSRGRRTPAAGSPFDPDALEGTGIDLVLPIGDPRPTGFLGLGRPLAGTLGHQEREFLEALLGIAANAIENARAHAEARRLNLQLDRRVQELRTLLELMRTLTATLDPPQVAQILGLTLAGQWMVRKYAVLAWREGHAPVARLRGMKITVDDALQQAVASLVEPTLRETLESAGSAALLQLARTADAQVLVPLRSADHTLGLVALGAPAGGRRFTDEDLQLCTGLAAQAVVAFENAWNFAETVERQKLERDLALAGDIQKGLFPARLPDLPGFQLAAQSRPAAQVGGDYFDAVAVTGAAEGPHLLCVADVSGKGFAASLLMSNMQATVHALLSTEIDPATLVARTNQLMHASTPGNKFVTALFLMIDPKTDRATYVNAGHNDGYLVRVDGTVETLPPGGMPVGMFPNVPYQRGEIQLRPGDVVALYSDGVNEANDIHGEEFGDDALQESLRRLRQGSAQEILDGVFADVDAFASGAPQYDDITLLVLKREG
jgi:phosphoserine phosphatase RsbU/P